MSKKKTVCVLLSTYNGEKFLREQLESVFAQEDVNVQLFVRDDGSKDSTIEILKEYEQKGMLSLTAGQNIGFAKSFSWLIKNAPEADYYACCDQDDVWLPRKLINGVEYLDSKDNSIPQLYFTTLIVVDEKLKEITRKTVTNYHNEVKNRLAENLVMNMISGCTTIFNNKLREAYSKIPSDLVHVHDYTLNALASALGEVYLSRDSQILYRQHANNAYGFNRGKLRNIIMSMKNFFRHELKSIRYREALNLKFYFYDSLKEEDKKFVQLISRYKFFKKDKKQLKKYIKKNVVCKSTRRYNLFLITFKKF